MERISEIPLPPSFPSTSGDSSSDQPPASPSQPPPKGGYVLASPAAAAAAAAAAVSAGAGLDHHSTSAERLLAISRLQSSRSELFSLSVHMVADRGSSGNEQGEKPLADEGDREGKGDKDIEGNEHDTGSIPAVGQTVQTPLPRTPPIVIAIDVEDQHDVSLLSAFESVLKLSKEVTREWPESDRNVLPEIYDGSSGEDPSKRADLLLSGKWFTIPRETTPPSDTDDEDSDTDSSDDDTATPVRSDKGQGLHSTQIFDDDRVEQVEEAVWRRTASGEQDLWNMFVLGPFIEAHIGQDELYKKPLFATAMPEPDEDLLSKVHETDCAPGLNDPVFMMVSSFSILGFRSAQFDMQTVITNRLGSPIIIYIADPGDLDDLCSDMTTEGEPGSDDILAESRCHGLVVLPPAKLLSAGVTYIRLVLYPMEGNGQGTGNRSSSAVIGAGWSYQLLSLGPALWEERPHWTDGWAEQIVPLVDVCVHRPVAELRNDYRMAQCIYRTTGFNLSRVFEQFEQGQSTRRAKWTTRAVQEVTS